MVINETKKANGEADVVYATDYYPFGEEITYAENGYRYGYQGQYAEKDKESAWLNFALRMYDPAIGRWMTTDPYGQHTSPYVAMGNSPVNRVDPDGGFDTWLGAFFYKVTHGGSISKNEDGFYQVSRVVDMDVDGKQMRGVEFATGRKGVGSGAFFEKYIWNSAVARSFVPDFYSIGGSFGIFFGPGYTAGINLTWVTRGKEKSLFPMLTYSAGLGIGAGASVDVTEGESYYTGNAADITRGMVYNTDGFKGLTYSAQGSVKAGLDIGVGANITRAGRHYIVGKTISKGFGLPTISFPLEGNVTATTTGLLKDFSR